MNSRSIASSPQAKNTPRSTRQAQRAKPKSAERVLGNSSVNAIADSLRISRPGDAEEQQADRVAKQAMQPKPNDSHAATSSAHAPNAQAGDNSPGSRQSTDSRNGQSLDAATREFFEPRFGQSLEHVRIHDDATTHQGARALHAKAYAVGSHIGFARGQYRPGTLAGRELLAHEIAHAVQTPAHARHHTIYRQPDGTAGDLAAVEFEIAQLQQIPLMGPEAAPVMMRLAQLEEERKRLLAGGAGAPPAPTVACTDKDKALNISKWRNRCLTVISRWRLFKEHVDDVANREDDRGRRLAAVADWNDYVTQEEFDRLDSKNRNNYHDLYDTYLKYYAGGGQYERQKREREEQQQKEKEPAQQTPAVATSWDDDPFANMTQLQIDSMEEMRSKMMPAATVPTAPPAPVVETGCHTDPYVRGKSSGTCGYKRPDAATQATLKAMQKPAFDFDAYRKQQRARLDRLNALHVQAKLTQQFPASNEFSQYEIAIDRDVDVRKRWQISAEQHGLDEDDLEADHYSPLLFRSRTEYDSEYRRRSREYAAAKQACDADHGLKWPKLSRKHPDWIDCENRVEGKYFPRGHARREAARWAAYIDIETAMPALTEAGPISAFGFHIAHEYLGWSTPRAAAFAGALSTVTSVGLLKTQQVFSNRNVGQSVAPADEMTPPPDHVAPAPTQDPVPAPTRVAPTTAPVRDPSVGSMPKVDVTNGRAYGQNAVQVAHADADSVTYTTPNYPKPEIGRSQGGTQTPVKPVVTVKASEQHPFDKELHPSEDDLEEMASGFLESVGVPRMGNAVDPNAPRIDRPAGSPRPGALSGDLGEAEEAANAGAGRLPPTYAQHISAATRDDLRRIFSERGDDALRVFVGRLNLPTVGLRQVEIPVVRDDAQASRSLVETRRVDRLFTEGGTIVLREVKNYPRATLRATASIERELADDLAILDRYSDARVDWHVTGNIAADFLARLEGLEKSMPGRFQLIRGSVFTVMP